MTLRSAASNSSSVAFSNEPLGRTIRSTLARLPNRPLAAQCSVGSLASSFSAWGSTSRTASICSIVPFGLPGVLQISAVPRDAGDAAREAAVGADQAHRLGQTRRLALDHRPRAFWRLVAGREAGAAGRHDQAGEAVAHLAQRLGDRVGAVLRSPGARRPRSRWRSGGRRGRGRRCRRGSRGTRRR